jgi:dTDP-4-dehydrorhamnose reductase
VVAEYLVGGLSRRAIGAGGVKRALLTGGSGQVGAAVLAAAQNAGWSFYAPKRDVLDLARPDTLIDAIGAEDWQIVINCGAYTAVDKAQEEKGLAHAVNRIAPSIIAQETALRGIPLIHVSTDYVFDGESPEPYSEEDRVSPVSVYGASKEGGEAAIRAVNPRHAIIRTAWVLSAEGSNFINTMLRLAETRKEVRVVNDQIGCPTSASDIAAALLTVADRMTASRKRPSGTWHFVNGGAATWYDLAAFVFERAAAAGLAVPRLSAIPTEDYPTPARRPANSQLSTSKYARDFGVTPRAWQDAVGDILDKRLQGNHT